MKDTKVRAEIQGREWVEFTIQEDSKGVITSAQWKSNGCSGLLKSSKLFAEKILKKKRSELNWPGAEHWDLLLQEVIMKLQGAFELPYSEEELCHCRKIPTQKVDQAIVLGAHTPEKVKAWTRASTGCGTCRPTIEQLIKFRIPDEPK